MIFHKINSHLLILYYIQVSAIVSKCFIINSWFERDTCTPMFIAALFTIARTQKQPRCHKQMDKEVVVHIHNGILLCYKKEHI